VVRADAAIAPRAHYAADSLVFRIVDHIEPKAPRVTYEPARWHTLVEIISRGPDPCVEEFSFGEQHLKDRARIRTRDAYRKYGSGAIFFKEGIEWHQNK
jgi:hypothetical protein